MSKTSPYGYEYSKTTGKFFAPQKPLEDEGRRHPFPNIDLQLDDEDDSDYKESEYDLMDSADIPSSPTPSETAIVDWERLEQDITRLEAAEAEPADTYDLNEIVALLTEFHELMVKMDHWPEGSIQQVLHDPPVNVELGKEVAYESQVLELIQKLPCLTRHPERDNNYITPETHWASYRQDKALREGRCPMVPHGSAHPNLDP
ncbi:hypothetical protein MMC15_003446 [Xylographa vitiligo]|nr:hypothetical protein [Xylographa vitiligo]